MPLGFPIVAGWCIAPATIFAAPMMPGGMFANGGNQFFMAVAGWVLFGGTPPL